MTAKFSIGQRVRIVRVDDIPYGLKYSYLEATIDKLGVIQDNNFQSSSYIVRLDEDGSLISVTENCLEDADIKVEGRNKMSAQEYETKIKMLEETLEGQQRQLKKFQDILELQELHTNYAYWLETRDWEKIVDLFTDDAVAILHKRGRFQGKAAIIDIFKNVVQTNRGKARNGHLALQPIIHVDGDKATAQWLMYLMALDPKGEYENIFQHGRHDMEYVRINGKWKIKYMLFTSPWPREAWSNPTLAQLAEWEKENKH